MGDIGDKISPGPAEMLQFGHIVNSQSHRYNLIDSFDGTGMNFQGALVEVKIDRRDLFPPERLLNQFLKLVLAGPGHQGTAFNQLAKQPLGDLVGAGNFEVALDDNQSLG